MRGKKALLAFSAAALILIAALISLRAYYITIALIAGTLIIGHRELWSLIRTRKLPPFDERVREHISKSLRNGFVFFAIASAFLMMLFGINTTFDSDMVHVLGGLFLSAGAVYLISYLFYDRAEPKLGQKELKMLKISLLLAGVSLGAFVISLVLHNAISALFGVEEPVFFFIAVFLTPFTFAVGTIGSLAVFLKGLLGRIQ